MKRERRIRRHGSTGPRLSRDCLQPRCRQMMVIANPPSTARRATKLPFKSDRQFNRFPSLASQSCRWQATGCCRLCTFRCRPPLEPFSPCAVSSRSLRRCACTPLPTLSPGPLRQSPCGFPCGHGSKASDNQCEAVRLPARPLQCRDCSPRPAATYRGVRSYCDWIDCARPHDGGPP
jgi:hypothetical protein